MFPIESTTGCATDLYIHIFVYVRSIIDIALRGHRKSFHVRYYAIGSGGDGNYYNYRAYCRLIRISCCVRLLWAREATEDENIVDHLVSKRQFRFVNFFRGIAYFCETSAR